MMLCARDAYCYADIADLLLRRRRYRFFFHAFASFSQLSFFRHYAFFR